MKIYLPLQIILSVLITISLVEASSLYCEEGWSLELRKGKDICYKYDKSIDKRYEEETQAPKGNGQWELVEDDEGFRDTWKRVK